ncbi:MAG: UvrB/UvrC motif-containing protein [bacterium]
MKCQVCHKNEATFHFTHVINGKVTEVHVCQACADEKGISKLPTDPQFSISDLISSLGELSNYIDSLAKVRARDEDESNLFCPRCGMTYRDFKKSGRFGCSECYTTFKDRVDKVLLSVHNNNRHVGKVPRYRSEIIARRQEIKRLRSRLQSAINNEEFEVAAELRDRIRELEGRGE